MTWLGQSVNQYEKLSGRDEEAQEYQEIEALQPSNHVNKTSHSIAHVLKYLYVFTIHLVLILLLARYLIWPYFYPHQRSSEAAGGSYIYPDIEPFIRTEERQVRGEFEHESVFKGEPNPELDAAWETIAEEPNMIGIDEETFSHLNKSAETALRVPEKYGGGYLASLEVTHQLHCLNMIRKFTYYDYYKARGGFVEYIPTFERINFHKDHCIDILRQSIMCAGDTHLITYTHKEGRPMPMPDFSIRKMCRSYEDIEKWTGERKVPLME